MTNPKHVLIILTLISGMLLTACRTKFTPQLTSDNGVRFKSISLAEAKSEAKLAGKPLFVFAHASWCPTCKKMEQDELPKQQLGDIYNKQFVNVAIDVDGKEGKPLSALYPIRATPTLFYFSSDGTLIRKWEGFATVAQLLELANQTSTSN